MYRKIILLGFVIASLVACNTKFSVNGEYEEKAIVHFLLDQGKEYQFLKLNKTFLKEGDALQFAKEGDLHYFDNVNAVVEEIINGSKIREWTLQDTIIQNKKDGIFYGPEQKLYYFKTSLSEADKLKEEAFYRLKIDVDNGNHIITGQTSLVKDVKIVSPQTNQSFNLAENNVQANGYKSTAITFSAGDAGTYKMQIRFDYDEYIGTEVTTKSVLWNIGSINRINMPTTTTAMFANGEAFYEYLAAKIPVNPDVTKRVVSGMEIILTAGSNDLQTYILSNAPTSSIAQNKPTYSNVEGALGIFSSRVTISQYKTAITPPNSRALNQNSTRELCKGQYTYMLGFCSDLPADAGTSFSCD